MKKGIALLLSAALVMTSFVQVFAADPNDTGLEKAINNAKSIVEVPTEYSKFEYSVNGYNGEKNWRLTWSTPKESKIKGQVSVSIDDSGYILNYDKYSQNDDTYSSSKLPKYSRQSAEDTAKSFIEKIQPGLSSKLEAENDNNKYIGARDYYFNFHYVQDSIPYYGFNCSVSVNGSTGEVRNYYGNKVTGLSFPSKNGVISKDVIEKTFIDANSLELRYMQSYEDEKVTFYPAYVLTQKGRGQYDAFTGELVESQGNRIYNGAMSSDKMMLAKAAGDYGSMLGNNLTHQELDAVKKIANVISTEDAEKIIRAIPEIGLDDTYKANSFNLYKDNKNKDQYVWNMSFQKDNEKDGVQKILVRNYISVSINAETGKLVSFYLGYNGASDDENKIDYATAKATAYAIAKQLEPEKFSQTELFGEKSSLEAQSSRIIISSGYSYNFRRVVNGVPCDSDYIQVGIDAKTGKVSSYSVDWYNGQFPSIENAISIEQAYKSLFEKVGVKLYYVNIQSSNTTDPKSDIDTKSEIKLVYSLNTKMTSTTIDAKTGELLDYQGKPYIEKNTLPYTDIKGHFSEQAVKVLQEFGVGFDSDKFLPDQSITQAEFLELIMKSIDSYFSQNVAKDKRQDYIYENLLRRGIIKENEVSPEALVTREDSVKFIIRNMNLQKVAEIKEIFICEFNDKDAISPDLIGYVTIAKGLKLISGYNGNFEPKSTLTRGEAAVLLYNSLK